MIGIMDMVLGAWGDCRLLGAVGQRAVGEKVGYGIEHHVALEQVVHGELSGVEILIWDGLCQASTRRRAG